MIKILIADDHAIVRKGLRQIIKEQAPYLAVGEAADGQAVLEKVRDESWDILLLACFRHRTDVCGIAL
jgi:two-component system invasion response regulator UvrY